MMPDPLVLEDCAIAMPAVESRAMSSADASFFIFSPMEMTAMDIVRKVHATGAGSERRGGAAI